MCSIYLLITFEIKGSKNLRKWLPSKVAKTLVPKLRGGGEESDGGTGERQPKWVQITGAVTAEERDPGSKILHSETKWIKLNGNLIIASKSTNGE
jgi:hypothetical protein